MFILLKSAGFSLSLFTIKQHDLERFVCFWSFSRVSLLQMELSNMITPDELSRLILYSCDAFLDRFYLSEFKPCAE